MIFAVWASLPLVALTPPLQRMCEGSGRRRYAFALDTFALDTFALEPVRAVEPRSVRDFFCCHDLSTEGSAYENSARQP